MAIKPKHVWYCVLAVLGTLAFFNIFSWPHDSTAAMIVLNKLDGILFRPTAHPTMFALVVGLAIGTVLLPEIWRVVRDHVFPAKPHPNWDARDAIDYLCVWSRWSVGRSYSANEHHILEEDVDEVVRDVASQGRITIWGRPTQTGAAEIFSRATEVAIPANEWPAMSFDLTTMVHGDAPHGVCVRNHGMDQYQWLRVDRREIYREWPPARWRLLFDRTWKGRKRGRNE